jgi:hypothetical protein
MSHFDSVPGGKNEAEKVSAAAMLTGLTDAEMNQVEGGGKIIDAVRTVVAEFNARQSPAPNAGGLSMEGVKALLNWASGFAR